MGRDKYIMLVDMMVYLSERSAKLPCLSNFGSVGEGAGEVHRCVGS